MFTLDTHPEEIIQHPLFKVNDLCRSTLRTRRWGDQTMREYLSRPPQAAIMDACRNVRDKVWHLCDENLQAAVSAYLERNNG